jgi:hypothetical protein
MHVYSIAQRDTVCLFEIGTICVAIGFNFGLRYDEIKNEIEAFTTDEPAAPKRVILGIKAYVRKDKTHFYSIKDDKSLNMFSVTITKIPQA